MAGKKWEKGLLRGCSGQHSYHAKSVSLVATAASRFFSGIQQELMRHFQSSFFAGKWYPCFTFRGQAQRGARCLSDDRLKQRHVSLTSHITPYSLAYSHVGVGWGTKGS